MLQSWHHDLQLAFDKLIHLVYFAFILEHIYLHALCTLLSTVQFILWSANCNGSLTSNTPSNMYALSSHYHLGSPSFLKEHWLGKMESLKV